MSSTISNHQSSGAESISTTEVQQRLWNTVQSLLQEKTNALVSSPTGSGKSYTVATTPWREYPALTGGKPVIHVSPTKAARDDAAEKSKLAGVSCGVLKGRDDTCPVAKGEHDDDLGTIDGLSPSEWLEHKCDVEHWPFSWAHTRLQAKLGTLPCNRDGECQAHSQWNDIPQNDNGDNDCDVIHVTANFAYVPSLIEGANVFFDEFPEYRPNIDQDHLRQVTTGLLQERGGRAYTWEGLVQAVTSQDRETLEEYEELLDSIEYKWWRKKGEKVDSLAPQVVRAIVKATPAGDGVFTGRYGRVGVILDQRNTLKAVFNPPDLTEARCVIGFDAHPSPLRWNLSTGLDLPVKTLLSPEEARHWRRRERELTVVQVGTATRSLTKGWRSRDEQKQADALIQELYAQHGDEFRTCVCPKSVENDVRESMEAAGITDPETLHYGEEKSRNDFATEKVGLVLGCIDPGDHHVLGMLGVLGLRAEPEEYHDENGERRRKFGRGFVGPDADAAHELLESVRRDSVAQAIGRYARNVGDPDSGARVYVWTDAIPDDLVDGVAPGVNSRVTEKKQAIEEVLRTAGSSTTGAEVSEAVGVSKKHALAVLNELVEQGIATCSPRTGKNGAHEYSYQTGTLDLAVDLDFREK